MGKSITIACIGEAPTGPNECRIFGAMNRLEIMQAQKKAEREGLKITQWYAQTKTGSKTLGMDAYSTHIYIPHKAVPTVRTVKCPVCNGQGIKKNPGSQFMISCVVCNGSGITKPGNWNRWRPWQIENMKKEFAEA